jgi:hypothetical protein
MTHFRPTHWVLAAMLMAGAMIALPGCQKYVNIPSQTGDVASANVNGSNVRNVMGQALRGLWVESPTGGPYVVLLPAGATPEAYNDVVAQGGEAYTWADREDAGNAVDTVEIRAVRIRGLKAAVDIVRSSQPGVPDAPKQLVTVYLKQYVIGGWASRQIRVWRMNVADALKQSASDRLDYENQP